MVISGRVQNGFVVLEGGSVLPEGAVVTVTYPAAPIVQAHAAKQRIQIPLVGSTRPGSVALSGARIAEILDKEDVSPRH